MLASRIVAARMRFPNSQSAGEIDGDRVYGVADNFVKCDDDNDVQGERLPSRW